MEKGMEKGIKQVAIQMLNKGFSDEIIADVTSLTKEEIKLLQEEVTAWVVYPGIPAINAERPG